jgi:hypothetical protein
MPRTERSTGASALVSAASRPGLRAASSGLSQRSRGRCREQHVTRCGRAHSRRSGVADGRVILPSAAHLNGRYVLAGPVVRRWSPARTEGGDRVHQPQRSRVRVNGTYLAGQKPAMYALGVRGVQGRCRQGGAQRRRAGRVVGGRRGESSEARDAARDTPAAGTALAVPPAPLPRLTILICPPYLDRGLTPTQLMVSTSPSPRIIPGALHLGRTTAIRAVGQGRVEAARRLRP